MHVCREDRANPLKFVMSGIHAANNLFLRPIARRERDQRAARARGIRSCAVSVYGTTMTRSQASAHR
jgi:hypothetical protein